MIAVSRKEMTMIRAAASCLIAIALAPHATAQPLEPGEEPEVVQVEWTSYHVPVFANHYATVLNVFIPPHRESGYHRHSLDSVGVLINDTARTGQVLGAEATITAPRGRGSVNFTRYASNPVVHNVAVTGDEPFHNIVVQLHGSGAHGSNVEARNQGYTQILDNDRVRVWRLALDPGETTPVIIQFAPGVRVVVDGGEIAESTPDGYERRMTLRSGEFFWQEESGVRAVRNVGTTRIELVELEIK
jgi:hypothetical protein